MYPSVAASENRPGANDKHHGFAVRIGLDDLALLIMICAAEVLRKSLAGQAAIANGFLEALQLV